MVQPALATVIAIFLAYGLYFGLTEGVEKAWVADMAPADARGHRVRDLQRRAWLRGSRGKPAFGAIWTRVSPRAAFLTGASLALVASVLLYLAFPDAKNSRYQR